MSDFSFLFSIIPVGSADFDHWAVHLREIEWSYGSCQDDTVIVASQDNTRVSGAYMYTETHLIKLYNSLYCMKQEVI